MNNSQNSLPELTARLTNELNIPLIITFSVLDVLEKDGHKIAVVEKLKYLQILQVSLTQISQSLDNALKDF
jgi:hypothetical protein